MSHNDFSGLEIVPGVGLGPVRFGMDQEEVRKLWGEPSSSTLEKEDGLCYYMVTYAGSIHLFFDEEEGFRLDTIEVDWEAACRLFGEDVFALDREGVGAFLGRHLDGSALADIAEERNDNVEEIAMKVKRIDLTLYFNFKDRLQEIQWGPFFDRERDQTIWPDQWIT